MAQLINIEYDEKKSKIFPVRDIKDFSLLGFIINDGNKSISLYYLLFDSEGDSFLVKQAYLLNDYQEDIKYFNHPLFSTLNIMKLPDIAKEDFKKIISKFDHTNSFYSTFKPYDIIDDNYYCDLCSYNTDEDTRVYKVSLPRDIFMKLELIRNKIIFKLPFNPSIERDNWKHKQIIKNVKVEYLGSDIAKDDNKFTLTFFKLSYQDNHTNNLPIGICYPVGNQKDKIITKTMKTLDFVSLYKFNHIISMDNLLLVSVKEDDKIVIKVAIVMDNLGIYIITDQDPIDSFLFNPYKIIYK